MVQVLSWPCKKNKNVIKVYSAEPFQWLIENTVYESLECSGALYKLRGIAMYSNR